MYLPSDAGCISWFEAEVGNQAACGEREGGDGVNATEENSVYVKAPVMPLHGVAFQA
jgi:hypothetical protein